MRSGGPGAPLIVIDGAAAGAGDGLTVSTGSTTSTTVEGVVISNFSGAAINVSSGTCGVQGCFLGIDPTGKVAAPNLTGIRCSGASTAVTVGGSVSSDLCVISGNAQAGADVSSGATVTLKNCYIGTDVTGSTALGNGTDGIACSGGSSTCTVGGTGAAETCIISGNGANGVNNNGATCTLQSCSIGAGATGTALGNAGAGVLSTGGARSTVVGGTIGFNLEGGWVDLANTAGTDSISSCILTANHSSGAGAALRLDSSATVTNCVIVGNQAASGGAVDVQSGSTALINCSFSGNSSYAVGAKGGSGETVTLLNCILYGDSTPEIQNPPSTLIVFNSLVATPVTISSGANNLIGVDPQYINAAGGNLRIQPTSPCVNAGTTSAASLTAPTTDIDGTAWYPGPNPAMGTYSPTALPPGTAPSATTLSTSRSPIGLGDPVTFTATVSTSLSYLGTPTGTITFMDGATVLGTSSLASGTATLTTSTLAASTHSVVAVYGGDSVFASSTSTALSQQVQSFSLSLQGSSAGNTVPGRFTLVVTGGAGGFDSAIAFSASGLPAGLTGTFEPPTVTPNGGSATTILTVSRASGKAAYSLDGGSTWPLLFIALCMVGAAHTPGRWLPHRRRAFCSAAAAAVTVAGLIVGCGGGVETAGYNVPLAPSAATSAPQESVSPSASPTATPTTISFTVTATSGNTSSSTVVNAQLTP